MPDRFDEKVINLFAKHKRQQHLSGEEKIARSEDGYYYVCVKKDENGKHFIEEDLLDRAEKCYYIVKVMLQQTDHPFIYNFKIPGKKILEFLSSYINQDKDGMIIEIDRYYPEELA